VSTWSPIVNIFLLSLVASLGTSLGGLIAVIHRPGRRSYGFLMGITAGVMISLSFLELVNHAWALQGFWTATIGFGLGATFMLILDYLAPHVHFGEREIRGEQGQVDSSGNPDYHPGRQRFRRMRQRNQWITDRQLVRTGLLLAIGITIHNLPEGIAVGAGFLNAPAFGIFIAAAIMLHNIPEGIATALPLCKGGVHRWDAFRVASLSGFAEPVGALLAALFLTSFKDLVPGALAFAGGVMMFLTLDELVPTAREHGHHHYTAVGIIVGSILVFVLSGIFGV